ncbi:MAG: hypothetical protein NZ954_01185 [Thermofilaceae archaeon]|nr:hypothetical protein [Thermofilaceae archaeon]MCX8180517.1 hypothetical protein [Thermofilaceae archaeon]MDW8003287.1 hypothetical protein [Thermofilaceae archaeon]
MPDLSSYLRKRDPLGFFTIPAKRDAMDLLSGFQDIIVEKMGPIILVKVKSRRLAKTILASLSERRLLADI